jgi:hypothetical protein
VAAALLGKSGATSKETTKRFITETWGCLGVKNFFAPFGSLIDISSYGDSRA